MSNHMQIFSKLYARRGTTVVVAGCPIVGSKGCGPTWTRRSAPKRLTRRGAKCGAHFRARTSH